MSKLSQLKAWVPVLTLATSSAAQAKFRLQCDSSQNQTRFVFWKPFENQKESTFILFDQVQMPNGENYFRGDGSLSGSGKITSSNINVNVSFVATGTTKEVTLGQLKGTKKGMGWTLEFIPAGTDGKLKKADKQTLFCEEID